MKKLLNKLSKELNLPEEVIEKYYKAYWIFIKTKIEELPLKEDLNEEKFSRLRTNFNIPNLGKLSCTYKRWLGVKKHYRNK